MIHTIKSSDQQFRILSLDGGGIRGVYIARFLAELEEHLKSEGKAHTSVYNYFDLICGTSTGGIIAIALALGIPAKEIEQLYTDNAKYIFRIERHQFLKQFFAAKYSNKYLELLLKQKFQEYSSDGDTRLGNARTRLCIPAFVASRGEVTIYKTSHHSDFIRDFQIPAYQVAMATSAAPTYFDAYTIRYHGMTDSVSQTVSHNIDGGIFANNPSLIGLIEAHGAIGIPWSNIQLLSIGTGLEHYSEMYKQKRWGALHWISKRRIIEAILQSQADQTHRICEVLSKGLGRNKDLGFVYQRIQFEFRKSHEMAKLDTAAKSKIEILLQRASYDFKTIGISTCNKFCERPVEPFIPCRPLPNCIIPSPKI
jgi:uncharacterized protein